MKAERWEEQIGKVERADDWGIPVISSDDVRTLFRRQHAAFVRLVERCQCDPEDGQTVENGYNQAKADILTALQQGRKP